MPDRRAFLKTVACASAAGFALGPYSYSLAQPARRQISIGGKRIKVVDIHAHCGIGGTRPMQIWRGALPAPRTRDLPNGARITLIASWL
jgi:hypothetical protein